MANPDTKKSNVDPGHGDKGGEGNYDAGRRYDAGVRKSVEQGKTDELAERAKKALEGDEGDELRRAEEQGKAGKTPGR